MTIESNGRQNFHILTQRFMSSQQWDRSLASSLEWLSQEPENLRAHRVAAQSLINLERTEEAGGHVEKVLAGNPDDDFAQRLMAIVHFKAGRFTPADESIHRAISLNPTDAYHWQQYAHMSYRQGDLATAKKCVARARELNPRDADILNLAILCEPDCAAATKIQQYKDALELDPENADIHNNMGVQYLDKLKDYAKAEACFRRALFFEPASEMSRKNLFLTVKNRDVVYRILCTPKDWLFAVYNFFHRTRKKNLLLYILLIPLWLVAFRFIIGGVILWFALVWPLTKVYEYLTIGDIRARAGELGVRRGGFLGYRQWPVKVRLSIFAVVLVSFWGAVALFCMGDSPLADKDRGQAILGVFIIVGAVIFIGYHLGRNIKNGIKAWTARKRARQMENILSPKREE